MGKFFNSKLKDMHYIPRGMEGMRQEFRKEQISVVDVPTEAITPKDVVNVSQPKMTPAERMAKARAAKRKNVVTANS